MRRLLVAIFVELGISVFVYVPCVAMPSNDPVHSLYRLDTETTRVLDVRIELREKNGLAGNVILRNISQNELRVWRMGNSWGDRTLSFVLIAEGRAYHIPMAPQVYTVNMPCYETLAPGQEYKIAFNLTDERHWEQTWKLVLTRVERGQLAAFYEAVYWPESHDHEVWSGSTGSSLVDVRYVPSGK